MSVHATAVVEEGAALGADVEIGPYAVIGPQVTVGARTRIGAHAVVENRTTIGEDNVIHPHAVIGGTPQDLKYHGEQTSLEIGDRNQIREFSTLHIGTEDGGGVTRLGSDCLVMAYSHIAHDCQVGDRVIMANCATLAGHVTIEDRSILGGLSGVHQFARVGQGAFVAGGSMITMDVPPFCTVQGDRAALVGLNLIGLKRAGLSDDEIGNLKKAYRTVFREGQKLGEAIEAARAEAGDDPRVKHFLDFIANSERGIIR